MKKFVFSLMAFALCASTLFTSCHKDDDDDDDGGISISSFKCNTKDGEFNTAIAGFYQSVKDNSSAASGTSKLSQLFGQDGAKKSTTIAATKDNKQVLITIKGIESGTYKLGAEISKPTTNDINQMLIDLLSGGTVKDIAGDYAEDLKDGFHNEALVIYRSTNSEEGNADYWFSTKAEVNFNVIVAYSTGSFTASMMNGSKDTFEMKGEFNVIGKPVLQAQ